MDKEKRINHQKGTPLKFVNYLDKEDLLNFKLQRQIKSIVQHPDLFSFLTIQNHSANLMSLVKEDKE